jgi:hypothetical protein
MKPSHAANDNQIDRQIARTRQVWQPRLGRDLTDEDARQITQRHRLLRRPRRMVAGGKLSAKPST